MTSHYKAAKRGTEPRSGGGGRDPRVFKSIFLNTNLALTAYRLMLRTPAFAGATIEIGRNRGALAERSANSARLFRRRCELFQAWAPAVLGLLHTRPGVRNRFPIS